MSACPDTRESISLIGNFGGAVVGSSDMNIEVFLDGNVIVARSADAMKAIIAEASGQLPASVIAARSRPGTIQNISLRENFGGFVLRSPNINVQLCSDGGIRAIVARSNGTMNTITSDTIDQLSGNAVIARPDGTISAIIADATAHHAASLHASLRCVRG